MARLMFVTGSRASEEAVRADRIKALAFSEALGRCGFATDHCIPKNAAELIENAKGADIVFCVPHSILDAAGKTANIHAVLERAGVPYAGSGPDAIELALSKPALKKKWRENGVLTPDGFSVSKKADGALGGLQSMNQASDFPYIVKPARDGNSRGITEESVVRTGTELESAIMALLETHDDVMAEHFLGDGLLVREFTVAMIGNFPHCLVMPAMIAFEGPKKVKVVTTEDKEFNRAVAVPIDSPAIKQRLARFATKAFEVAGVRDYARCDIIEADGVLYAIEINGQPMIPDPWFEACARGAGFTGSAYLSAVIFAAAVRYEKSGGGKLPVDDKLREALPDFAREALDSTAPKKGIL